MEYGILQRCGLRARDAYVTQSAQGNLDHAKTGPQTAYWQSLGYLCVQLTERNVKIRKEKIKVFPCFSANIPHLGVR